MSKERGIMFTAENADKVRLSAKTQTRRVLNTRRAPYQVGDKLWVREPFAYVTVDSGRSAAVEGAAYRSDMTWRSRDASQTDRLGVVHGLVSRQFSDSIDRAFWWRPAMFMPRWASRTSLEVTAVRVERLQDISEEDACAEGVTFAHGWWQGATHKIKGTPKVFPTAVQAFRSRWDALYAGSPAKQWEANPWVVALTFHRAG